MLSQFWQLTIQMRATHIQIGQWAKFLSLYPLTHTSLFKMHTSAMIFHNNLVSELIAFLNRLSSSASLLSNALWATISLWRLWNKQSMIKEKCARSVCMCVRVCMWNNVTFQEVLYTCSGTIMKYPIYTCMQQWLTVLEIVLCIIQCMQSGQGWFQSSANLLTWKGILSSRLEYRLLNSARTSPLSTQWMLTL